MINDNSSDRCAPQALSPDWSRLLTVILVPAGHQREQHKCQEEEEVYRGVRVVEATSR